jgi:phospholipase/carboxylesterase
MSRVNRLIASLAIVLAAGVSFAASACRKEGPPPPLPGPPVVAMPMPTATATATTTTTTVEPEAAGLRFLERVTGGANANDPLPLIVGIHGRGGRPEHFGRALSMVTIRARVILPYAPTPAGDGFSWLPDWTNDADFARDIRPVADRIAAMITDLVAKRRTVGKPVVTGFSQGGMISFAIAVTHPEVVGAVFPISGFLAPPLFPSVWPPGAPKIPVYAFHGTADAMVPIEGARFTVRRLKELGLDARLTEYPGVGHRVVPEMQRDVVAAIEEALQSP